MIDKNKTRVVLDISFKKLDEIADYYEFPVAVFLTPDGFLKKGETRNKKLLEKAEAFDKIKEIIGELVVVR